MIALGRRDLVVGGAAAGLASWLAGCGSSDVEPSAEVLVLPDLAAVQQTIAAIALAVAEFEPVRMLEGPVPSSADGRHPATADDWPRLTGARRRRGDDRMLTPCATM